MPVSLGVNVQFTMCTGYINQSSRGKEVTGDRCATYNIATNTWTEAGTVAVAINHPGYCTNGDELRIIAGRKGKNSAAQTAFGTCQTYDLATQQTGSCTDLPYPTGGTGACVSATGGFWIFGGELNAAQFGAFGAELDGTKDSGSNQGVLPVASFYDSAAGTWSRKANMPIAKKGFQPAVHDGYVYIAGGGIKSGGSGSATAHRAKLTDLLQCPDA